MNEPLAGRRLVSFTMSPKRLEVLRRHCVESPTSCAWFDGVAVYVSEWLPDDRYVETYRDGGTRLVVVEEWPRIEVDDVQEARTYVRGYKWPRHQRPLRNLRNRSV